VDELLGRVALARREGRLRRPGLTLSGSHRRLVYGVGWVAVHARCWLIPPPLVPSFFRFLVFFFSLLSFKALFSWSTLVD
jgi:hypothetical protein